MKRQNRSAAVMAQRSEPRDSLDDFPTPPWATRALFRKVIWRNMDVFAPDKVTAEHSCWEPACNRGYMARPLKEVFGDVHCSDVHDYSDEFPEQDRICDFLFPRMEPPHIARGGIDWIITNPPFKLAEKFIQRAFALEPRWGVAMFVRLSFLEGKDRYRDLFSINPPTIVSPFAERVVLHKGVVRDPDKKFWGQNPKTGEWEWRRADTATAYCWLTWIMGQEPRAPVWIPPCRSEMTRPDDYAASELTWGDAAVVAGLDTGADRPPDINED